MKTIFFSFSAQTIFKNFFFFHGGLYDMINDYLTAHEDVRFVIVITVGNRNGLELFFQERPPHARCILEAVPFPKGCTPSQRVFRFFYSYFIYTGTTRIMATLGIRPDEPPAGGRFKKYLAPIKIAIAHTFGKSRWMRARAVPALFYRIFSQRHFKEIFERYTPDLVFVPHLYGLFDTALLAEAKQRGVKSIGMVSNWDHFDKYYLPFKADTVLAQSEQIKRFAVDYQGYDPERVFVVGYPSFDFIVDIEKRPRSELMQSLEFPPDARYLLYISGSAYCKDEPEIIQEILKWIDGGKLGSNVYLIIRPYAGTRPADREGDKEKFEQFLSHPKVRIYAGQFWGNVDKTAGFMNIMGYADVVLVVYSTAVLEAAIFDRPMIAPTFDGRQKRPFSKSIRRFEVREHFKDVLATGALKQAYNFEDLFRFIAEYLENPAKDADKRAILREKLCYKTDGQVNQRILNYLLNVIQ